MTPWQTLAAIVTAAALASYLNYRVLRLPATIGLMAIALAFSLLLIGVSWLAPFDVPGAFAFIASIDFGDVLLHAMLPFLLFAGALHVDVRQLRDHVYAVAMLSTLGVLATAMLTGGLLWLAAGWLGLPIRLVDALLFGALIAPTDPIAVLGILHAARAPRALSTVMAGESLLNDGVGVVVFLTLLDIAATGGEVHLATALWAFLVQAVGGLSFGLLVGGLGYIILRTVDDYPVEIFLTLGIAGGGYAAAEALHVSAPLAIVAAGLVIGSIGREAGMSKATRDQLDAFWEVVDEMLNAVLFLLIGLELLVIKLEVAYVVLGIAAIAVVLVARFTSVATLLALRPRRSSLRRGASVILTWGGLRGGISIALALSLPAGDARSALVAATYVVVLFAVLVQGLTLRRVVRRYHAPTTSPRAAEAQ